MKRNLKIKRGVAAARLKILEVAEQEKLTDKEIVPYISELITLLTTENNKYIQQDYSE